jgi:phospholipid N-methyltransferase
MMNTRSEDVESSVSRFRLRQSQAMILHALRNPFAVGAIAAASPRLVTDVVSQIDNQSDVVVELGAGTGVITQALLESRNHRHGVVSIEIDRHLAEIARARLPDSAEVIIGDAIKLASYFDVDQVDSIICSLPLTLLSRQDLDELLAAARQVLKEGGQFVFYLYRMGLLTPRYRKVMRRARHYFSSVNENNTVWRNLPPARVIVCR